MDTCRIVPFSVRLDNVEELHDLSADRDISTVYYKDGRRRTTNYHFRVFRATGTEAMITLSDWARDWDRPDTAMFEADVGHEIMWDHIKIQPYYDGDPTEP